MGYENDPTTLTYSLALFEKYGKDYKPLLNIAFVNGDYLGNVLLVSAGPDWISVVKDGQTFMIPSTNIVTALIKG